MGSLKTSNHSEDLDVDGKILTLSLRKYSGRVWIETFGSGCEPLACVY
jgi:hypothetical protein